jgi:hypothetical protein
MKLLKQSIPRKDAWGSLQIMSKFIAAYAHEIAAYAQSDISAYRFSDPAFVAIYASSYCGLCVNPLQLIRESYGLTHNLLSPLYKKQ